VGGAVDPGSEAHDMVMTLFGGMSKGERTCIQLRVKASMFDLAQRSDRFLGGRPPTGTSSRTSARTRIRVRRPPDSERTDLSPTRPPRRSSPASSTCSSAKEPACGRSRNDSRGPTSSWVGCPPSASATQPGYPAVTPRREQPERSRAHRYPVATASCSVRPSPAVSPAWRLLRANNAPLVLLVSADRHSKGAQTARPPDWRVRTRSCCDPLTIAQRPDPPC